ncbi:GNAT family N-acetyltransferase [Anabaena azotica]|uniref:GNAT family N-acetyltransferase n=1 Tax=Anabaena azotica FACHB-119 TaxID=947527 RepID=A0ABR8DGX9_9NOST|nr:GNAT family N-acetyltransferase [Anabaena azotica]MBD2505447.1 GNAT family N-acetyltransferase [Anabaena azotica FACHB-119]
MELNICALEETGHTRSSLKKIDFNCGDKKEDKELSKYLKQLAWKNNEISIARTFVACDIENPKCIFGYYTASMSLIEVKNLPDDLKDSLPGYPIPAMLIGKFAVNRSVQRKGIGKKLIRHAFENVIEISKKVAVYAVIVDAKNKEVKEYYIEQAGFLSLIDRPLSVYIPVISIKEAQANAQKAMQSQEISSIN